MVEILSNPFEAFTQTGSALADAAKDVYEQELMSDSSTPLLHALSRFDQKRASKLASELNIMHYEQVLTFGSEAQHAMKNFSSQLLAHIQRKDTSMIGDILYQLMDQLDQINPDALIEKKPGILDKLFKRPGPSIQQTMSQYNRLSKYIDRLSIQLQHSQEGLLKDYVMLDDLYKTNEEYFTDINVYIAAGELKRKEIQETMIPAIETRMNASLNPMVEQELADMRMRLEWIDQRIYDLEISREIAIQSAPQIRLIQQTHQMLIDKVQTSILTTIPLWQSQISMLLSMNQQRRASEAQRRLLNTSDEVLQKNAAMATAAAGKQDQGLTQADVDHFKQTQLRLLEDIEEALRVQAIANEKRRLTEADLQ